MTEYSHFWGGEHIGDIASDWRVSDDDFAKMMRNIFGLGTAYIWDVGLPAGYSIKTQCGVLKGRYNELEVTMTLLDVIIDSGVAIVDGRIYYNDTSGLWPDTIVAPVAGTNHYLVGLEAIKAVQTVRAVVIGPELDPANLVQPFTPGVDVFEPLAAITIDDGSSVTIYDLRRFIRPMGYQLMPLMARQGDGESEKWDEAGIDTIEIGSDVGVMFGCIQYDVEARSAGYALKHIGDVFEYGMAFVTHAGTDPNVIAAANYYQTPEGGGQGVLVISWGTNDGSSIDLPIFHFVVIGKLSTEYHAWLSPGEVLDRTLQDE